MNNELEILSIILRYENIKSSVLAKSNSDETKWTIASLCTKCIDLLNTSVGKLDVEKLMIYDEVVRIDEEINRLMGK